MGFLVLVLVVVGTLTNVVAGYFAHKRGEPWGGRIAALGIAVWVATVVLPPLLGRG